MLVPWGNAVGLQDGSQGSIDMLKGFHTSIHIPQTIPGLMVSVAKEILGFVEVMRDLLLRDLTERYYILINIVKNIRVAIQPSPRRDPWLGSPDRLPCQAGRDHEPFPQIQLRCGPCFLYPTTRRLIADDVRNCVGVP